VGPRAGLDKEDRGKILCPCRGSNPDRPVIQPVVRHYTARANPAPLIQNTKFKNTFSLNQNSTISLTVEWEVCEKSTFLSLFLDKGMVDV
jgi:hypothetical protein